MGLKHLCKQDGLVCSSYYNSAGEEILTLEYPFDVEYEDEICEEMREVDVLACPFCGYKKDKSNFRVERINDG